MDGSRRRERRGHEDGQPGWLQRVSTATGWLVVGMLIGLGIAVVAAVVGSLTG